MIQHLHNAPYAQDWLRVEQHRRNLTRQRSSTKKVPRKASLPARENDQPQKEVSGGGGSEGGADDGVAVARRMIHELRIRNAAASMSAQRDIESENAEVAPSNGQRAAGDAGLSYDASGPQVPGPNAPGATHTDNVSSSDYLSSTPATPLARMLFPLMWGGQSNVVPKDPHAQEPSSPAHAHEEYFGGAVMTHDCRALKVKMKKKRKGKAPFLKTWLRQKERELEHAQQQTAGAEAVGHRGHDRAVCDRAEHGSAWAAGAGVEISSGVPSLQMFYSQMLQFVVGGGGAGGVEDGGEGRDEMQDDHGQILHLQYPALGSGAGGGSVGTRVYAGARTHACREGNERRSEADGVGGSGCRSGCAEERGHEGPKRAEIEEGDETGMSENWPSTASFSSSQELDPRGGAGAGADDLDEIVLEQENDPRCAPCVGERESARRLCVNITHSTLC